MLADALVLVLVLVSSGGWSVTGLVSMGSWSALMNTELRTLPCSFPLT